VPRYTDESKDRVRQAADIVDLVSARTDLRRAGPGRFMGLCPFHEERTPSFSVNADEGLYHCFGCGAGGDVFSFVMETEGLDFVGALESLAQRYGVELEVADEDPAAAERRKRRERLLEVLERAASFYERWLWESREAEPARRYLRGRGITEETLRTYRVGYAPSAWDRLMNAGLQGGFTHREMYDAGLLVRPNKSRPPARLYDRFRRRIMFPLTDQRGRVLGFGARALGADQQPKYINSSDNEIYHKGRQLFGAHLARAAAARAGEVIVAEGYMDVLALHQAGIENVVGIMGTSLTEDQVGELGKLARRVLLALDADNAGQEAMVRAARVAQGRRLELRVVPLDEGRDPADIVTEDGPEAARALIERSVPFVSFRVERELATGDATTAEGKDRIIAALRPIFAQVPPSALREELLAHVASRLDLQPALVSSWLAQPGSREPGSGAPTAHRGEPGGSQAPPPRLPRQAPLSPVVRAERDFLVHCIAMPDEAEPLLASVPDEAFSSDGMRRVVAHLRGHLRAPAEGLPEDEPGLRRAIAALVAAADQIRPSRAALQGQLANVELAHLDRQIEAAKASGAGGIAELRARRERLVERRDMLIQQWLDETAPVE
jgi:DNA primase